MLDNNQNNTEEDIDEEQALIDAEEQEGAYKQPNSILYYIIFGFIFVFFTLYDFVWNHFGQDTANKIFRPKNKK